LESQLARMWFVTAAVTVALLLANSNRAAAQLSVGSCAPVYYDTVFVGPTFRSFVVREGYMGCAAACSASVNANEEIDRCLLWTYDITTQLCRFQRTQVNPQFNSSAVSGAVSNMACFGYRGAMSNVDLNANDIGDVSAASDVACAQVCYNTPRCVAWVYKASTQRCYPKHTISIAAAVSGVVSGYRPSSSISSCSGILQNIDFSGNDIGDVSAASDVACAQVCYNTPSCVAWVYKASTQRCYPKHTISTPSAANGVVSGYRPAASCTSCSGVLQNTDLVGGDVSNSANGTAAASDVLCAQLCRDTPSCVAWVYQASTQTCYPKQRINFPSPMDGAVVGYRSPSVCACAAGSVLQPQGCAACPVGTFSAAGAVSCTPCPPGSFTNASGSVSCALCPAGTASGIIGASSASACKPCPVGYVASSGSTTCVACSAGSAPLPDQSACSLCPIGMYASAAALSCTFCPANTFSNTQGAPTCTSCSSGMVSAGGASYCCRTLTDAATKAGQAALAIGGLGSTLVKAEKCIVAGCQSALGLVSDFISTTSKLSGALNAFSSATSMCAS